MKPIFQHDCDRCTFLGSVLIKNKNYDLYHCNSIFEATIIARWSDEGADYSSGAWSGENALVRYVNGDARGNAPLMVAYTLAMANGLDVSEKTAVADAPLIEKIKNFTK